jgi:hypothetical protein
MTLVEEFLKLKGINSITADSGRFILTDLLEDFEDFIKYKESPICESDNVSFDEFWDLYDKKIDRPVCQKKWDKLKQSEKEAIMKYIPLYKQAEPDKKFRKNPETFINRKSWENEIILPVNVADKSQNTIDIITKLRQLNGTS